MSHLSDLVPCEDLQTRLETLFLNCDPALIREAVPLIEFAASPYNTRGTLQKLIAPGDSKIRTVKFIYDQRLGEDEVGDDCTEICVSTNEDGELSTTYDPTLCVERNWRVPLSKLQTVCVNDADYINRQIQKNISVLIRKMESDAVSKLQDYVGAFPANDFDYGDSSDPIDGGVKKVKTEKDSSSDPNWNAIQQVKFSAMNMAMCGAPVIFGGGMPWAYFDLLRNGCCAASGVNLESVLNSSGLAFLMDYRFDTVFGPDRFVMVGPGAVQLIYWNEFVGAEGIISFDTQTYKRTVIFDPETGIPFDYSATFDCGVWNFQLKLLWDLVGAPSDMFHSGDRLAGVTYVNEFEIENV